MFLNSCGKRSGRIAASATRDGTRIRCQELCSCTIRWVARRFPARGWVLAEQTRIWIPLGGTAIPRHRLGSRGRLLLAFCRAVTARRKPAHSLFRLYSVEKIFSTTPLLPSRTPHVLGLRKPRSHKCRGWHNLAQSFAWLLATHLLPRQPRVIFFQVFAARPPVAGQIDGALHTAPPG